jgi:hypothetical protein
MLHRRAWDIKLFVRMLQRREAGITNCLCKCYIEERQIYQIVYVNVTSKRGRDIKLFVRSSHRRGEAEISNCLCNCYIKERQRYQIVYVNVTSKSQGYQFVCENVTSKSLGYQIVCENVTSKRGRDIQLFM